MKRLPTLEDCPECNFQKQDRSLSAFGTRTASS
jgi:hypothetical protein